MASERRQPKRLVRASGFFFSAVLLGTLVRAGAAYAQCGSIGPISVKNMACGMAALASITTGKSDSAFGHYALNLNTTGHYNTATGAQALEFNTRGFENTAVGWRAGEQVGLCLAQDREAR